MGDGASEVWEPGLGMKERAVRNFFKRRRKGGHGFAGQLADPVWCAALGLAIPHASEVWDAWLSQGVLILWERDRSGLCTATTAASPWVEAPGGRRLASALRLESAWAIRYGTRRFAVCIPQPFQNLARRSRIELVPTEQRAGRDQSASAQYRETG
jgi:hypothetical protein